MKRRFRLNRSTEFKRVRRLGRSYAHPLVVFVVARQAGNDTRIGISASKSVGNAVVRNRVKRRIRAVMEQIAPEMKTGYRVIIIARAPISNAAYQDINEAIVTLCQRAQLMNENKVNL